MTAVVVKPQPRGNTVVKRPVLRWHGGKFRIAPWIIGHFPKHRVYVEPFAGAASVLLRKERVYAEYLNDLDGEIVNLFRVLQDEERAQKLIELLLVTPFARAEFELAEEPNFDPVERARRLCIRSFMGFGSVGATGYKYGTGFRCKSFRASTGPSMDWRNYPPSLGAIIDRLRGVCIESRPALQVIQTLDTAETLFYADPPYVSATRGSSSVYRHEMTDQEHENLAACLKTCEGYVVLSGYRCELYDDLFVGWIRQQKQCMGDAGKRIECLWISPRTWAALKEERAAVTVRIQQAKFL